MKIAIVFEPDASLGVDPLDPHESPRRQGVFLDSDKLDILLVWREMGEQFEDGSLTHVVSSGVWENITDQQRDQVIAWLAHDEEPSS
jgi:hypothetical protein